MFQAINNRWHLKFNQFSLLAALAQRYIMILLLSDVVWQRKKAFGIKYAHNLELRNQHLSFLIAKNNKELAKKKKPGNALANGRDQRFGYISSGVYYFHRKAFSCFRIRFFIFINLKLLLKFLAYGICSFTKKKISWHKNVDKVSRKISTYFSIRFPTVIATETNE